LSKKNNSQPPKSLGYCGFPRKSEHAPQIVLKQSLYDKKPKKRAQRSDQWGHRFSILQDVQESYCLVYRTFKWQGSRFLLGFVSVVLFKMQSTAWPLCWAPTVYLLYLHLQANKNLDQKPSISVTASGLVVFFRRSGPPSKFQLVWSISGSTSQLRVNHRRVTF